MKYLIIILAFISSELHAELLGLVSVNESGTLNLYTLGNSGVAGGTLSINETNIFFEKNLNDELVISGFFNKIFEGDYECILINESVSIYEYNRSQSNRRTWKRNSIGSLVNEMSFELNIEQRKQCEMISNKL